MPFGYLDPAQQDALRTIIEGRVVTDLGAGDCEYAKRLLELGASRVVAVDKEFYHGWTDDRLELFEGYFRDFDRPIDVAFLSWPANWHTPGLIEALERAAAIVYLGKNTDGSACGTPALFRMLTQREVQVHVPAWKNTLIVYGTQHVTRPRLGEEQAAIDTQRVYEFVEAVYLDGSGGTHAPRIPCGSDQTIRLQHPRRFRG